MPSYYDEKTKTWWCKFYYTDYTGEKKQKKKRGFKLQREAKEWERTFLEKQQSDITMSLSAFTTLYIDDMRTRLRTTTINNKERLIKDKIIPAFGKMRLCDITPTMIRKWQNDIMTTLNGNGQPFTQTYIKCINNQLSAIFNYAVRYYGLNQNPCRIAGTIGKSKTERMSFWTFEEFSKVIHIIDEIEPYTIYMTMYYTGMRIGEVLALTRNDIDLNTGIIHIVKSMQRIKKEYVITAPKTPKSKRDVTIPPLLVDCLQTYINRLYMPSDNELIFKLSRESIRKKLNAYCLKAEVKKIRLHDFRHSHASLLIEMGFSPLLIAERLGHENIETTLNIYSHLYPNKQNEVSERLQALSSTVLVPTTFI